MLRESSGANCGCIVQKLLLLKILSVEHLLVLQLESLLVIDFREHAVSKRNTGLGIASTQALKVAVPSSHGEVLRLAHRRGSSCLLRRVEVLGSVLLLSLI